MQSPSIYLLIADAILFIHVLFVVFGLLLVFLGGAPGWHWVRNPYFRVAHLAAIGVVILQAWIGMICALTTWEMALRAKAGDATYSGSFMARWLRTLLYYDAPAWVLVVCYTLFGLLVVGSWFWVRPRRFGN